MHKKTLELFNKLQEFSEASEQDCTNYNLGLLSNKYAGETAYILTCGPSLSKHDSDKLRNFLSDKFVIGIKQVYDDFGDVVDIHVNNFSNYHGYDYDSETIVLWALTSNNQLQYIIKNNIETHLTFPVIRNEYNSGIKHGDEMFSQSMSYIKDWENMLISSSVPRPWGPGIMYECVLPVAIHCGVKRIVTIGWDIGELRDEDDGKDLIKYDHFYAEGVDNGKHEYSDKVWRIPGVGGSSSISNYEVKLIASAVESLNEFLKNMGIEFNILSETNPASDKIKRIKFNEL